MSPFEAREQGLIANIPILTGICREDGSPYTLICMLLLNSKLVIIDIHVIFLSRTLKLSFP